MRLDKLSKTLGEDFKKVGSWEQRYQLLIELGKKLQTYPEDFRLDKFKIKGCQSQVWLYPEFKDGQINFWADSDALLVKGIVALLVNIYSGSTPDEILNFKPDFLKQIGLTEHLSMNRSNGLNSMIKQIQLYAIVFKAQKEQNS